VLLLFLLMFITREY